MNDHQKRTQKALGIAFVIAQAGGIAIAFFYPLATIAWLIALAPLGWRYLKSDSDVNTNVI